MKPDPRSTLPRRELSRQPAQPNAPIGEPSLNTKALEVLRTLETTTSDWWT